MGKSGIQKLGIDIAKLQNRQYEFDFKIDDQFFQRFEDSLIDQGAADILAKVSKTETLIEIDLTINGNVVLTCDRSLDPFDYPLSIHQPLIYKFGAEEIELDDYMFQILPGTVTIYLDQLTYELISLSLPMKKLHPRFAEEADDDDDEGQLVYSSEIESEEEDLPEDEELDPRWQKLNDLKKK